MRKLVMAAGLLMAAAFVPGAPAQAAVGCQCVRLGTPSVCMATVTACNTQMQGVCVAPCTYSAKKMVKRHAVKRRMVRAGSHPAKKHKVAKKPAAKKKPKKM